MEQDFQEDIQVNVSVSLTELCSFWYGLIALIPLHKLEHKVVLVH